MTTAQLPLTGLELKERGQQSLERHRWVDDARIVAEAMCHLMGWTTSDTLHAEMDEPPPHPNCWGAIFRDKRFVWAGTYNRSRRPEAHARMIRVWRLR
jgi:hypothetical protein